MPEQLRASVLPPAKAQLLRIGHGYDLHRLEPCVDSCARPLRIGSIAFDHDRSPIGHSDADALLHAVTDALLGALALPDIGQLFPDHDPANFGRDSREFLSRAAELVRAHGYSIANIDATVILEKPKIGPRKREIVAAIAALLDLDVGQVNVKGKTHENVDAVGEGLAIEVHCVALLVSQP
jgi:2-C-methyl-D-erythritol 2,4-cyclodiphosphate synthase